MNKRIKKKKNSDRTHDYQIVMFYSQRKLAYILDYEYEHNLLKNNKKFQFKITNCRRAFRTIKNHSLSLANKIARRNINENHISII